MTRSRGLRRSLRGTLEERLWAQVAPPNERGCREFVGAQVNRRPGPGKLKDEHGRPIIPARAAWTVTNGPIPPGLLVCHRCDNPPCCEISHLFLGTHLDNMRDMSEKGRGRTRPSSGEQNPNALLDPATAAEIRRRYDSGGIRQVDLATEFGVSQSLVSLVVRREAWIDAGSPL
jgi:hypothetical protein